MTSLPTIVPLFPPDRRRVRVGLLAGVTTHRKTWGVMPVHYRVELDNGGDVWVAECELGDDIAIPAVPRPWGPRLACSDGTRVDRPAVRLVDTWRGPGAGGAA